MKLTRLNIIMLLGLIAITGILIIQLFLLRQAIRQEENKFSQKARVALLEVARRVYQDSHEELPEINPVKEISEDYYVVNVNREFKANILEYYLKTELVKFDLATDFEYAIYNCETEGMVYGNYVSFDSTKGNQHNPTLKYFPRQKNLVYYFAIHFPRKSQLVYSSLILWIVFSVVMVFVLIIYIYSSFQLLQQKKYSELQRDFINNMTHEFKTPLSSILLSSNFISKQQAVVNDEKLKKYTEIIIQQAGRLNKQVEKVLDLARAESDFFKIHTEQVLPETVLTEVIENISMKHADAEIKLTTKTDAGKAIIAADIFHFSNLVYNLLDNAIKYSKGAACVQIGMKLENKLLKLNFSDTGIGIDQQYQEQIFDKFYRIPGKKMNEVSGFGLGLFYVKKICDAHHWKIQVQSESGKGTIITLTIPVLS